MKKVIKFIFLFSIVFCLKGIAQEPGDSKPLSNKTTIKGKRELRKENRKQSAAANLASKNERQSRMKNNIGTVNKHKSKSKKLARERRREKRAAQKKADQGKKTESVETKPQG